MSTKFKFIQVEDEGETEYLVVSEASIQTIPASSCYDQYGQVVGYEEAGDYAEILTEEGAGICNKAYNEAQDWDDESEPINKFQVGDCVSAYDHSDVFAALINSAAQNFKFEQQMVKAIEYYGDHFQTFVLDGEAPDGTIVDDEELIVELETAIADMSYVGEYTGYKNYESGDYYITESFWQGSFERYRISRK